ncbi:MAG: A24 family peptidase [Candidatus Aenigmarchaeota archaeon]|nr:A24 family peptidase [Candidatus Aenigmarchaeota archaeon]
MKMFEWFLIFVALIGSFIAGIIDLKTTEIPDEIPYVMAFIGILVHIIQAIMLKSYTPILYSSLAGLGFLVFGFFMYYTGQWGGGDAKLLSALGFLLPNISNSKTYFPFSLSLFFNVFFVGAIYMIIYALGLSIKEKRIWEEFSHDLKSNMGVFLTFNAVIALVLMLFNMIFLRFFITSSFIELVLIEIKIIGFVILLFFVYRFSKTVEETAFKKRIPVSMLKEGDVLLESKLWEGLTKEEVKKIKKSGVKYVWIKEGVRFGLAFPLALLFTLFVGDGILLIIHMV